MTDTDRKFYAPARPYMDAPQSIGHGVTISAPHMVNTVYIYKTKILLISIHYYLYLIYDIPKHAFALEYLKDHLKPGNRVLDVGSGSGYLTACFWRFINNEKGNNENTKIVGIEHQAALVTKSKENMNNDNPNILLSDQVIIVG